MYRIDNRPEVISEIQTYLREVGNFYGDVPKLSVDGIYGEETREAVRLFQERKNLTQTGEVDAETFEALYLAFLPLSLKKRHRSFLIPAELFPLRLGDSGSYIRILQNVLDELLEEHIPADGFFGRATENGVRTVEGRYGMPQTGILTQALWERLCADYTAALSSKLVN